MVVQFLVHLHLVLVSLPVIVLDSKSSYRILLLLLEMMMNQEV